VLGNTKYSFFVDNPIGFALFLIGINTISQLPGSDFPYANPTLDVSTKKSGKLYTEPV